MAKRPNQISTSVPARTRKKFDELCQAYGTGSAVLTVAIDRLYAEERPSDEERLRAGATDVPCAKCSKPVDPSSNWISGIYDEVYCESCQKGGKNGKSNFAN